MEVCAAHSYLSVVSPGEYLFIDYYVDLKIHFIYHFFLKQKYKKGRKDMNIIQNHFKANITYIDFF